MPINTAMVEGKAEGDVEMLSVQEQIDIDVLNVIYQLQQRHGLRHADYARYRRFCTKKISKLRRSTNLKCSSRPKRFVKPKLPEIIKDERIPLISLFLAERAWSKAMDLRLSPQSSEQEVSAYDVRRCLKRAVSAAKEMMNMVDGDQFTARTKLQVEAYCKWLTGILLFESGRWAESLEALNFAKEVFEKLASISVTADQRDIFLKKVEDFSPNIRYCTFQLGDAENSVDTLKTKPDISDQNSQLFEKLISNTLEGRNEASTRIELFGGFIPIQNVYAKSALTSTSDALVSLQSNILSIEDKRKLLNTLISKYARAIQSLAIQLANDQTFQLYQERQQLIGCQLSAMLKTYIHCCHARALLILERALVDYRKLFENKKPLDSLKTINRLLKYSEEITYIETVAAADRIGKSEANSDDPKKSLFDFIAAARLFIISKTLGGGKAIKERACLLHNVQKMLEESKLSVKLLQAILPRCPWLDILNCLAQACHADSLKVCLDSVKNPDFPEMDEELEEFYQWRAPELIPIMAKPIFYNLAGEELEFPELPSKETKEQGLLSGIVKIFWSR